MIHARMRYQTCQFVTLAHRRGGRLSGSGGAAALISASVVEEGLFKGWGRVGGCALMMKPNKHGAIMVKSQGRVDELCDLLSQTIKRDSRRLIRRLSVY